MDVLQNCDDVRFGGHSDTASSPELTQLATFQETGHQALFDARGESDAAVLPTDIFSQTLNSTSDRTDEDDGDYGFHTRTDPETSTKSVKIERNDQPWISLQAFNAEVTGQRASKAEVTEGSRVFFFIDRSPNQPAMNVRIWLDYHSKIFSSEYLPTLSNQHLVQFTEGQESAIISFDTDNDRLNEGDGMIRADLDLSPTAISDYRVDSESAWFRVVDDDIPEVTLSISTNSIVEGEEYSWFLERDCCTDFDLHVATYLEQVKFYPDDVWEDLVVSEPHNSRLDGPSLGGFIASGRTRLEWRRGPSITSELVGPQGGYQRRRLREFPADDFNGIPEKGDLTFYPRYTVSSADWVRIDWVNSAPGVLIDSAGTTLSVDEGDEIVLTIRRYGGAPNVIPHFASNVRVLIGQTGNYLADDQLGVRTVTISPDSTSASLRIPTRNDNVALADGTVTITLLEGSPTDRTEDTYELDSRFSTLLNRLPHTAKVTVANDDIGGVFISETMLKVEEGGSNEYTVVLDLQPTGTVTVTPSVSDGSSELVSVSGAMTFTADNWNIAQTVTVSAREDDVRSVETAEIRHDVSGADYDSVEAESVSIAIIDNDAPWVSLTLSDTSIGENGGIAMVTASLSETLSVVTLIRVLVQPVPPGSPGDYALSSNPTLTIPAGQTTSVGIVTVTAADNDVDAPDKTVQVGGNTSNPLGIAGPYDVTLTITDDDARGVTLSETDLDLDEGGDGTYTVVLDSEPTAAVTVTPLRSSGDSDVLVSGPLTFTASNWNTAQTVTVNAAQDSDSDDDTAVIGHSVAGGDYTDFVAESVTVMVNDDETASDSITLTAAPASLAESASATNVTVTATLNGGTRDADTPVAVNVGSGTAISGTDFAAVSAFTITIPANTQSQTESFSLDPIQDAIDEPDETVVVDGSTTVSGISITDTTVTITDDDSAPAVTLSLSDDLIGENGGETTVTASLSHASSEATTVTISVDPNSPATNSDYSISTNRVLTIAAGQTASVGTVTISAADNNIDAPDKTVQVKGEATNTLGIADPSDTVLTIADDDARGVTLSETDLDLNEGGEGTYTVVLDSEPTAAVTVTPSRSSGDSDVTVSGSLTFTASNWNTALTVTVNAAQDSDPDDDTAVIGHSVAGGDYADLVAESVTVTVNDDETASDSVTLTATPASLAESASATTVTVTATLNGGTRDTDTPVAVNVGSGTATSGADFTAVSDFTITIPANTQSQTGTFSLDPIQDAIDEPDETVVVDGSTTVSGISITDTTVTITDDDSAPAITLSLSDDPIGENGGATTVTATLSNPSSVQTTVTISIDPNSPATSSDYLIGSNQVLTIAAGQTASTGTVTVTAADNDIDAADKTVSVSGEASNALGIADPSAVTLTITDDDVRGVILSETDLDLDEGGDGTYTVVLDSEPTAAVTVMPSRSSGDSDVTVSDPLTFTPSNWNTAQTVTVSATQDSDADDDTAVIGHSVAGGDYDSLDAESVTITVNDDETASDNITLTVVPASLAESASATTITVTATLNGGTRDADTPVAVNVGSGTATSGADFTAVSDFTITIPANTQSQTGTFSLDPVQDAIDEPDETVAVVGSTTISGISITDTTVTITDDDSVPTVTLSLSDDPIGENGGETTVTATLSNPSSVQTTVTISVDPDSPVTSGDYSISTNRVLIIAVGQTASVGTVTITAVNNDIDAPDKTVQVTGDAANVHGIADPSDVMLTIADDDARGVTLSETDLDLDEGGEGTYTVVLDSEPTAAVTVTPSRSSGDSDVTVSDPLTFTPSNWNTAQTVTVSATQDSDADDDTAVIGHSVAGGDYDSLDAESVTITVNDDETASDNITLTVAPASLAESASATTITVTATLNGGTRDADTPVAVNVGSGTATSGSDFTAVSDFTITIPANTQSQTGTFSLDPLQDTIDEPDETVAVDGSTTISGISVTDTMVTITDDDSAPAVTLSLSDDPINENGGATTVTASLSHASSEATTVTISVDPNSPATSANYSISTNRVLTIAAGQTVSSGTVTITVADNDIDAPDKTVVVQGEASNPLGIAGPSEVTLTIQDDDLRGVTISETDLYLDEGGEGTYTVVLDSEPTAAVTVTPSRSSGDSDVTVSGPLTFTASNWNTAQTVTVSTAQDSDPDDDAAVIGHSVAGGDYADFVAESVTVTVNDDETASDSITLTAAPASLAESASATAITVTAALNGGTRDADTPVTISVGSGTATSGSDFTAVNDFTITIPANTQSQTGTFSLDPIQDAIDEPDETVDVDGSTTISGISVTDTMVTITDDDSAPAVTLSLSDDPINENGGATTVTASLSHASSEATTVTISVDPNSPATSANYSISTNRVLTIAAGQTVSSGTVTITVADNDIDAPDKTVVVQGEASNPLGIAGPSEVTLTIQDDDLRGVTISETDLYLDEGGEGTYTVVLDSEPTAPVTVTPSRSSGDSDVTVSGSLTFTASNWNTAQTVTVNAAQDSDADDDTAVIGHLVAGGDYADLVAESVTVMVNDDETASDSVTLTAIPGELAESASTTDITITATLNGGTRDAATPVTISVGSGTATLGSDFTAVNDFTITIPANTQSQTGTFSLDPIQDGIDEPDETVVVDGSTTISGISITDTAVTITDDDSAPAVTLSLSNDPIGENGGTTTVTASLSHASSEATTVTVSVDPNSPATSTDYSISANRVLTIAAGQTASAGTVTITAADNDIDAPDKTVVVQGEATNPLGIADPSDVTLTITDDDMRGVTLSETDLDLEEGGDGTYTVVLDSEPTAPVTVTPSRSSGDSDVSVSGPLTFTASNWDTAQTVTVNAAQDSDPDDDTAVIDHSVAGGDYADFVAESITVTVNDDETASDSVTLTAIPGELAEGASTTDITITATLNGGTRDAATPVTISVGSGTATLDSDFTAVNDFTIMIPANTQSQTGTFSLDPIQDTIDEPDETVAVDGSTIVNGLSITNTTVTIIDDDSIPAITLSLSDDPINENGGATTVTASLSHASSEATTVTISVDPNSPATSADYSISTNRVLTIAAGQTASAGTVTITAADNDIDAPDKTVVVQGEATNPLGTADPSEVTLTIADDDARGVTLSETDLDLEEGGGGTYTVVLDSEPTAPVTVTPSRSSGDSDVSVSGPLTFTASNWDTAQTVTVNAAQDNDPDDDTAVIGHSVAGGDYADFVAESVTVMVNDDETASDSITLTAAPASLAESASATTITVTAALNGGTRDADTPVAVNVGSGTATSGADFAAVSAFTITISANTQSQTGTFSLNPIQDGIDEPDETVVVDGSTTISGISITDTAVTITDDDSAPAVTLSLSDDPIGENGGTTTVTASLSHASSEATTVTVSVDPYSSAASADYSISANRVLTIAAGQTASAGKVTITAADNDIDAPDKTVVVQGEATNPLGIADPSDVTLTITDDDMRGVTLSETDLDLEEGGDGTYTVVLDSEPTAPVTVTPSRSSGDSDVSVSGPLTFTASNWDTAQIVTMNAAQDSDADDDTAVIDHSVAGGDYADFVAESITVTVNDDETASDSITLTAAPTSLAESNSAATITVTATLNGGTRDADTPVAVNVGSGTATSGADFAAVSAFTITIPAKTQSQTGTFSLDPIQDGIDEPDETVAVDGSTTVSGISVTDTMVTITDDDSAPTVTLALSEDLIGEDGGETTVTATLSNPSSVQTTVTISVEPDSPATSVDYSISANKVLTIAAGQTASTGMVTITAVNNALDTPNKTVQVKGGASNPLGITDPSDVTLTIVDDDGIRLTEDQDNQPPSEVTLSVAPAEVGEGDGAVEITVSAALNGRPLTHSTPISVSVVSGTATSGTDFTAVSTFTLTITAGALSGTETFSFVPTSDTIDEPDETVVVGGLTSINGLTVNGTEFEIIDDDSTPAVTLALSDDPIGENGGETTVTASLSHASSEATTVTISVDPNSPATGADYLISTNRVLTIAAGQTASEGTVTITAADNDIDAPDKTVVVQGEATNPFGIADPSDVTLTITDDDARGVTLSETDLDLDEGGDGTYTVVLDSEPTAPVTVTPSRSSGDSDVTVSGSLTFTASNWNTAQTITVNAAQDSDPDDDAAVIGHSVAGGDYADFVAESITVMVNDDETASDSITLTAAPASLAESASATTITVTAALNGGTRDVDTPIAVNVGSGTATSGADYAAVSAFTITIPANTQSQTESFSLDPIQDAIDEPDETVVVDGSTTVSGISITDTTVTITDDDSAPAVTLSLSNDLIGENGGATTVTALLSHASSEATTVMISVNPDSPASSADYSISTNRILTIAAGQTLSTGTVTITAVDNDIDAPDKTVKVKGEASNALGITDPSDITLAITDDDMRGLTLSETDLDLDEGSDGIYTVVLDSEPTAAVTVTPSRSSGDSDVSVSGTLTFTASNWNTAQTVTVNAAQDSDPDDDTAVIGHSVAGGDYADFVAESITIMVNDDETASDSITLTAAPASLAESASTTTITVMAALNGGTRDADTPVAVNVGSGTATSGADYAAVSAFTITIPANTLSQTGTFSLDPIQDAIDEPDETVVVDGSTTVSGISVTDTMVTITDDDSAPAVTLSLSDDPIGENGGATTVTASLSHASSEATTVTISVDPNSPATSSDYSISTNRVLTIAAGQTATAGTVTITAADNDIDAPDKTVKVKGEATNPLGIADPSDITLTITDDDMRGVTLSETNLDLEEGGDGTYTVVLDSEPTAAVTVTPSRSSGDLDVTASGTLTFTATNWNTAQTVTVSAAQDSDADDDTAVIGHSVAGGDYTDFVAESVTVTVNDDETASNGVTLTAVPTSLAESASAATVTVTATLNGSTRDADTPIAVNVGSGSGSGTATVGVDFAAVGAFTITIPANTLSQTGTFSLDPIQDAIDEPDETVTVAGSTTVGGISVTDTAITITDDDFAPTVALMLTPTTIVESDDPQTNDTEEHKTTVTATLSHASSTATAVTVSVVPSAPADSDDYELSDNRILTIAAGAIASSGTVTIRAIDNDEDEADRTFLVEGSAINSQGIGTVSGAKLTITDDDESNVNNKPYGTDRSVEFDEDNSYRFQATDFGFRDADGEDSLVSVRITSLPARGLLRVSGSQATAGQFISREEIDEGELAFVPGANQHGSPYADFGFRFGDGKDESETANTMTLNVRSVNDPATGQPVISGAAVNGEVLFALTSQIRDIDGMTGASFEYQWFRLNGGEEIEVPEANGSTWSLMEADIGSALKVRVRFTDDDGFDEELFSDPTDAVEPAPPTEPINFRVVNGNERAVLTWEPPLDDGGSKIVDYEIRHSQDVTVPDSQAWISTGTDLTETIPGISAGEHYSFEVRAVNQAGAGPPASSDLFPVDTRSPPGVPLNLTATPGDRQAILEWEPPASDGGAEISQYEYRFTQGVSVPDDTAWLSAGMALTVTVNGLINGQPCAFEVRAVNEIGAGPAAPATADLPIPATVPAAPRGLTAAAGERQVTLTWEPPANDGGAEISDYEVRFAAAELPVNTEWQSVGTDLTESIAGLDADQRYRFEVRAVNSIGPGPAAAASAATPRPKRISAALIEGWLARFGRTAASDTAEAIRQRLEEGPQRNQLVLNGRTVDRLFDRHEEETKTLSLARMPEIGAGGYSAVPDIASGFGVDFEVGMENGRITNAGVGHNRGLPKLSDMLLRSSFHYAFAQEPELAGPEGMVTHTLWGSANGSRFDANINALSLDGEVMTGTMGYDRQIGRLLTGVALSYSDGEGRFRDPAAGSGVIASDLSGVYPYAYFQVDHRTSLWGVVGYGKGELQLMPDDASFRTAAADLDNAMAAFGGRGVLSIREGASRRFEFALRGDALLTDTSADSAPAFAESGASTQRLRLMLEATGSIRGANGIFSPTLEAGLRHDAGDAEQGTGFELGGGLAWSAGPLTLQLNGRGLLAHKDEAYREWGYSASVQYQPGTDGRGLLLDLSSARGSDNGGSARMWSMPDVGGMVREQRESPGQSIRFRLGYGLESAGRRVLWHPFVGIETFTNEGRALRLGFRINAGERMEAGLEFGRRISGFELPLDTIRLRGTIRW